MNIDNLDKNTLVSFYKKMLFFRLFEQRVNVAYTKRKFSGFCHLHIGQEAVVVGVQENLRKKDYVISSYRSHTQAIAKGIKAKYVLAELFGKEKGCCKGKGGSMHMFSKEHRFLGGHGIVGGQVPLANGAAFSINYKNEDNIVVCYLGDGALHQGQVMESFNIASKWQLPVLYIIENNEYAMGTSVKRVTNLKNLKDRANGFNMKNADVNGMDVFEVYFKIKNIVKDMRKDKNPFLLEALTYRYKGHSVSDPAHYRTSDELNYYKNLDPIKNMSEILIKNNFLNESDLNSIKEEIKKELKEIETYADQAKVPDISSRFEDVFV